MSDDRPFAPLWLYRWPDGKSALCEKPADVSDLGDDEDWRDTPPPKDVRMKARAVEEAAAAAPAATSTIFKGPTDPGFAAGTGRTADAG